MRAFINTVAVCFFCTLIAAVACAEETKLTVSDPGYFGCSLSVSGNRVLVGDYYADNKGAVYVFEHDGTSWAQSAKQTASDGAASCFFGRAVSVCENWAVIGAYKADAAYVYEFGSTPPSASDQTESAVAAQEIVIDLAAAVSGSRPRRREKREYRAQPTR